MNGTIVVSRAANLHGLIEKHLEALGFSNVTVTAAEKDGLDMLIRKLKPKLLMMDAWFYQSATPYMVRELLEVHEGLNIAIVSVDYCATSLAAWFIWYGAKSYLRLWDGCEEFLMGLRLICEGKEYVSPLVQNLIDLSEWPDTKCRETRRLMACLIMLCSGFTPEMIGEVQNISRKTVHNHLNSLYRNFHAKNREEMVAMAWTLGLVTKDDIRFFGGKTDYAPLSEWAEAKRRLARKNCRFRRRMGNLQ
jgi:DNA-binding NarL/FixJ family response regulator